MRRLDRRTPELQQRFSKISVQMRLNSSPNVVALVPNRGNDLVDIKLPASAKIGFAGCGKESE